jgi:hypothetical protein
MEITRLYRGTPTDFIALLMLLEIDLNANFGMRVINGLSVPVFTENLELRFLHPGTESGILRLRQLPDGNSQLSLSAKGDEWPAVKAWWDLIDREMVAQGLLATWYGVEHL